MKDKLNQHKKKIIFLALGIGIGSLLGMLPQSLPFVKENAKFVYIGLIALGGYCFIQFYDRVHTGHPTIKRTVPSRNLHSAPAYRQDLRHQRGPLPKTNLPPQFEQNEGIPVGRPNEHTFDVFRKD